MNTQIINELSNKIDDNNFFFMLASINAYKNIITINIK